MRRRIIYYGKKGTIYSELDNSPKGEKEDEVVFSCGSWNKPFPDNSLAANLELLLKTSGYYPLRLEEEEIERISVIEVEEKSN